MDPRYVHDEIAVVFTEKHKLDLWQETELALIKARENLGLIAKGIFDQIKEVWQSMPIDIEWWKRKDKEIHHDLNAFVFERTRHLPAELQAYAHDGITSYDTEEPAFARMIKEAIKVVCKLYSQNILTLKGLAKKHRYTIMNARTHGQEAELQTFGLRCLSWIAEMRAAHEAFVEARKYLCFSKLSGAIGKYGSIDPDLEREALDILGFKPFYGATQIMPRVLYAPLASALCGLVLVVEKIGLDIRLGARSGLPILQEPFRKTQTGSSAMPQKKNTIRTEGLEGFGRMAEGYLAMIMKNVVTWEERAIEQSRVERVAWPDLFHTAASALETLNGVLERLQVYPDNMLEEIRRSRGTYAAPEAKEFLKKRLAGTAPDLTYEDAYRMVQLACFNVFESSTERLAIRSAVPSCFDDTWKSLQSLSELPQEKIVSIQDFIPEARLRVSENLAITSDQVKRYNGALLVLFGQDGAKEEWDKLFTPAYLLRNEAALYKEIIGE